MTFKYGFYNSVGGDRVYDADDMASILGGIINDGVYSGFGDEFAVTASTGINVIVGTGRAWLLNTWSYNDAALTLTLPASNALQPRYDLVILEVDKSTAVRTNAIKVLAGTPAASPVNPTLTFNGVKNQYALARVLRPKNSSTISAGNITNMIGTTGVAWATSDLVNPAPAAGRIYRSSQWQSLPTSETGVQVDLNSVDFLKGGMTSSTDNGGSLIVPSDGMYNVSATSFYSGGWRLHAWTKIVKRTAAQPAIDVGILVSSIYKYRDDDYVNTMSKLVNLTAGDRLSLRAGMYWREDGSGATSVYGYATDPSSTALEAVRLGP